MTGKTALSSIQVLGALTFLSTVQLLVPISCWWHLFLIAVFPVFWGYLIAHQLGMDSSCFLTLMNKNQSSSNNTHGLHPCSNMQSILSTFIFSSFVRSIQVAKIISRFSVFQFITFSNPIQLCLPSLSNPNFLLATRSTFINFRNEAGIERHFWTTYLGTDLYWNYFCCSLWAN